MLLQKLDALNQTIKLTKIYLRNTKTTISQSYHGARRIFLVMKNQEYSLEIGHLMVCSYRQQGFHRNDINFQLILRGTFPLLNHSYDLLTLDLTKK